jgi:hypothetical protein
MQKAKNLSNKSDDSSNDEIKDVKEYYSGKEKAVQFDKVKDLLKHLDD